MRAREPRPNRRRVRSGDGRGPGCCIRRGRCVGCRCWSLEPRYDRRRVRTSGTSFAHKNLTNLSVHRNSPSTSILRKSVVQTSTQEQTCPWTMASLCNQVWSMYQTDEFITCITLSSDCRYTIPFAPPKMYIHSHMAHRKEVAITYTSTY